MEHTPVLLDEVLKMSELSFAPEFLLDGTFGRGGHTRALMEKYPELKVIALDRDSQAIEYAKDHFQTEINDKKLYIFNENYINLAQLKSDLLPILGDKKFDLILLDLGVSSPQLDQAERGFSFYHDGPLDMRMDKRDELTAEEIVNEWSEDELRDLFFHYGEVRKPGRVVKKIVEKRKEEPFKTTAQLSRLIELTEGWRKKGHHPATNYFLALRLRVNEELDQVKQAVPQLLNELSEGGRLLVITFHSLEDRIVKIIYKKNKEEKFGIMVNKKVIQAQWPEKKKNPRARSAKLRVFQRSQHES